MNNIVKGLRIYVNFRRGNLVDSVSVYKEQSISFEYDDPKKKLDSFLSVLYAEINNRNHGDFIITIHKTYDHPERMDDPTHRYILWGGYGGYEKRPFVSQGWDGGWCGGIFPEVGIIKPENKWLAMFKAIADELRELVDVHAPKS